MQNRKGDKETTERKHLIPKYYETPDSSSDMKSVVLLVFLYLLQGVPLGLSFGSIPYLLKSKLNYSDLALFSLSSYPYSLKLLWSPIVDTLFFKRLGRRKSWIMPMQIILGGLLVMIGSTIDATLEETHIPVNMLAIVFTIMVLLCATQDIAVDGWALELLTEENKTYASTAQAIGLNTGYFLSFTVFLALNSPEFCNSYLRSKSLDHGLISLGNYLQFWGIMFLICTFWLFYFTREKPANVHSDEIQTAYSTIWSICTMPHMRSFLVIMLIAKIGFIANDSVTGLKLLELGFNKEHLALAVLIDFPFQIIFGYYAAKWSSGDKPLRPWIYGFLGRLFTAFAALFVVSAYPKDGVTTSYFLLVMLIMVLNSFMSTVQFVGMGSYFTKISDPAIGGTYMTLLNTLSNLGGTWPKYFVLLAVEYFTEAPCSSLDADGGIINCTDQKAKDLCTKMSGTCSYQKDGYYFVNSLCISFGLITLLFYILPKVQELERLPDSMWRLKRKNQE